MGDHVFVRASALIIAFSWLGACSQDSESAAAQVDASVQEIPAQRSFVEENAGATSANGSYVLDEEKGSLVVNIASSTFACDGPEEGQSVTFSVVEVSDTELILEESGEQMIFSRLGEGSGLQGDWELREEDGTLQLLFSFQENGDFVVSSLPGDCKEEDEGYTSEDGCYVTDLSRQTTMQMDGRLEDWNQAGVISLQDPSDDSSPTVQGDEITEMAIAADADNLYILLKLAEPLNENFRMQDGEFAGAYEFSIRHDSGGTYDLRLVYQAPDEMNEGWSFMRQEGDQSFALADQAIELRVSWESMGSPTQVYDISTFIRDCSNGADCEEFDQGPCFSEAN